MKAESGTLYDIRLPFGVRTSPANNVKREILLSFLHKESFGIYTGYQRNLYEITFWKIEFLNKDSTSANARELQDG